ncbi:MAG: hypothetical protein JRG68_00495, partial [Deltaproteobacteria bacterium]|nr:hypothetical protein [Deltaproteobacteria bacterium]
IGGKIHIQAGHFIESNHRPEVGTIYKFGHFLGELTTSAMIGQAAGGDDVQITIGENFALPVHRKNMNGIPTQPTLLSDLQEISLQTTERKIFKKAECQPH